MSVNEEARRQRLDELFADEPHLSPTMKAQRLHEKVRTAQTGTLPPPVVPPLPAQMAQQTLSLHRAAEMLRVGANWNAVPYDAATTRLFRFRDTTLRQWLVDAPEIRIAGAAGEER